MITLAFFYVVGCLKSQQTNLCTVRIYNHTLIDSLNVMNLMVKKHLF
ncbi:hypothetical protein AEST_29080 [Alishewanella aestuarii B11]|uniref:Uncharacterized protein n=1 Tax=Alishewanella aestuarii B11 TaxID=1197174 RepID=J2IBN6_9ALTE|nr:hypothetical protein AEST_29080 [Alishewanella aestuarii B11]